MGNSSRNQLQIALNLLLIGLLAVLVIRLDQPNRQRRHKRDFRAMNEKAKNDAR